MDIDRAALPMDPLFAQQLVDGAALSTDDAGLTVVQRYRWILCLRTTDAWFGSTIDRAAPSMDSLFAQLSINQPLRIVKRYGWFFDR